MDSMQQERKFKQLELPLTYGERMGCPKTIGGGAEGSMAGCKTENSVKEEALIESIIERENLLNALKQVKRNKGSAGVDGMKIEELSSYLKIQWPRIKEELLQGKYQPQPVKRVEIPKVNGGVRNIGIPCCVDRFIGQAILQVLQERWDKGFSENSYGFRPKRRAHEAIRKVETYLRSGKRWTVDMDLEKFFDRVNHDKLMGLVAQRVRDKRLLLLLRKYLTCGVMMGGVSSVTEEGTPQGSPLSPLLSNLLLDQLDKELERRGHSFARYADDCNIYVKSKEAGERVMKSVTKFIERELKLVVNRSKSAVARPWKRKFLGFTFSVRKGNACKIAPESIKRFKRKIRDLSNRTRGVGIKRMISDLNSYIRGWSGYFRIAQMKSDLKELDQWIRRRLRTMLWKQWGRSRYRKLISLGIDRLLAWNTCKSAHGLWRISHSPALEYGLSVKYFDKLGLYRLERLMIT